MGRCEDVLTNWRVMLLYPAHEHAVAINALLCEDSRLDCRTFTRLENALELLEVETYDIALIASEFVNGVDLEPIYRRQPHLPIIVIENQANVPLSDPPSEQVLGYLTWPTDSAEIASTIGRILNISPNDHEAVFQPPQCNSTQPEVEDCDASLQNEKTIRADFELSFDKNPDFSFACLWILQEHRLCDSVLRVRIQERIVALDGEVITLEINHRFVDLVASLPKASSRFPECIANLLPKGVRVKAHLYCEPANALNELVRREFLF